jgi:hypothetical protein
MLVKLVACEAAITMARYRQRPDRDLSLLLVLRVSRVATGEPTVAAWSAGGSRLRLPNMLPSH